MRFCNRITFTQAATRNPSASILSLQQEAPGRQTGSGQPRLREQFPFLSEPGCPVELQALVTRKITRYHEYRALYPRLRECDDLRQCADVAGRLLDAYLDNQAIFRELEHYQKHRRVLGRHPFFRHFQQLNRLRSMSVRELIREQAKTKDNIWRVNSEIRKGNKPHLDESRRLKLQQYELKLQEINSLLGE